MIAIVKSQFNSQITNGLLDGCINALKRDGFQQKEIIVQALKLL